MLTEVLWVKKSNFLQEDTFSEIKSSLDRRDFPASEELILWLKQHLPRSDFISHCQDYIQNYENAYFCGRNHYERAKSILAVITPETNDEDFVALIIQQVNHFKWQRCRYRFR